MKWDTSILELKGIGEKSAELFHKVGIYRVGELIEYYPRDYEQFEGLRTVKDCIDGEINGVRVTIIRGPVQKKVRNLSILSYVGQDSTGVIGLTFFNMPFLKNTIRQGGTYIFRGTVQIRNGQTVIEQAKLYKEDEFKRLEGTIQPKYPLTKGLTNQAVTKAVKQALSTLDLPETLPEKIKAQYNLQNYAEAIKIIHFPDSFEQLAEARKRLAFDELFYFILMIRRCREGNERLRSVYSYIETADTTQFIEKLPYRLTGAQNRVWEEIKKDMLSGQVMNRLVQGDVGSGKTILAFLALLLTVSNGLQGAMMAPTEVLAKQHFENMMELTQKYKLPFKPVLLTGSLTAKAKRMAQEQIEAGEANVIIGTHAVIQEKVNYHKLALVITDEQHRFGVRQRETFFEKGQHPHVLVMSATPIPRTLAIILYGDLDISVVDELPANRLPIKNCVVNRSYRRKAYEFMEKEIRAGHQVYCICPMVEDGELEEVENVVEYTEKLKSVFSPEIQIACLHGKMKPAVKNQIMEQFGEHHIDILVSTTVIEVGINVPNATVMLVENAERFGLAQLHQLRGRVGRGGAQSYCIFMSGSDKPDIMKRLDILNKSNDGFEIAGADLKMRGPGDLFGTRQSGAMNFKLADIYRDAVTLGEANSCVEKLLEDDPELEKEENRVLQHYLSITVDRAVDFQTL